MKAEPEVSLVLQVVARLSKMGKAARRKRRQM